MLVPESSSNQRAKTMLLLLLFFFFFLYTLKLTYASGGKLVSGILLTNKQNGQLTCSSVQPERCQGCTRLFFMDLSVQIDLALALPFISLLIFCVQSFINLMHLRAAKIWTFHRNYAGPPPPSAAAT